MSLAQGYGVTKGERWEAKVEYEGMCVIATSRAWDEQTSCSEFWILDKDV